MPDAGENRLPKWPLRLVLSLVLVLEVLIVVAFFFQGVADNIPMLVNSVGLIVFCVLTWRGIPWSRWLLVAFLVCRVVHIAVALGSHFGDHRTGSSLMLAALYIAAGALVASPLGHSRVRAAT